ncbi:MAG: UDP-N-acetylmuramate dehydrogenase [Candidatus Paracaedibacteraceae bacterium]|nr:UDP-N-acetylmuramate dehydrogenase [Candidatus Paracaedibacteraceae bacterium]
MSLRESLPEVRGRYSFDAAMSDQTWFRVGGPADVLYKPADLDDLIHFLKNRPESVPLYVVGAGSNLLVRDGGVRGIVIRLGRGFSSIERDGFLVTVGAAALDRTVAMSCGQWGLSGLEFLVGVPGTIGGAVKMNAGCYGAETKDRLVWADVLSFDGTLHHLTQDQLEMTYRHSNLRPDQIVIAAQFRCDEGDSAQILNRLDQLLAEREASQPVRGRTGGSTFRNPAGQSAWKLIDEAGCRGLMVGQAQVSEKHTNFLLNTDHCSAADLEELGERVRQKVKDKSGYDLHWEIVRMGQKQS